MNPAPANLDERRARLDAATFGGIGSRAEPGAVKVYRGMRGSRDGMRATLRGAWARCLDRHGGKAPPSLLSCTQSEVAGYFWSRHGRESARVFRQLEGAERLRKVFPSVDLLLHLVSTED